MNKQALALVENEDELFGSLLSELDIPQDLLQYDIEVGEKEIRRLGERAFLRWLYYHLKGKNVPVRKSAVPLVCEDAETVVEYAPGQEVETTFFPDTPVAEEYNHGENDMLYIEDARVAKVQTLLAIEACNVCPIASICLDTSIIQAQADEVHGIWGGHHEGTRKLILNRYNKLRRAYLSTKTNDMSDDERVYYRDKANTMNFDG